MTLVYFFLMYLCMYKCVYSCLCIWMYCLNMHSCAYICVCISVCTCGCAVHIYWVFMHMWMHWCLCIWMYYSCLCSCAYICVCAYVCVVYICTGMVTYVCMWVQRLEDKFLQCHPQENYLLWDEVIHWP